MLREPVDRRELHAGIDWDVERARDRVSVAPTASMLAVSGSAQLGGTLAMVPNSGYVTSAAPGDVVPVLTYGSLSGAFTTVNSMPALDSGEDFTSTDDVTAKTVDAVVGARSRRSPRWRR